MFYVNVSLYRLNGSYYFRTRYGKMFVVRPQHVNNKDDKVLFYTLSSRSHAAPHGKRVEKKSLLHNVRLLRFINIVIRFADTVYTHVHAHIIISTKLIIYYDSCLVGEEYTWVITSIIYCAKRRSRKRTSKKFYSLLSSRSHRFSAFK